MGLLKTLTCTKVALRCPTKERGATPRASTRSACQESVSGQGDNTIEGDGGKVKMSIMTDVRDDMSLSRRCFSHSLLKLLRS